LRMTENSIPIIDISLESDFIVKLIRKSCIEVGFFYLTGHGIDSQFINQVFEASKAFFKLPENEKMKVFADKNNRGYNPMYEEILDPSFQKVGDTKEGFYIGREIHPTSEEAKKPLHGPNQYPSEQLLPGWKQTMTTYFNAMSNLGFRVVQILAQSLNLPKHFFDSKFDKPVALLRLLHYAPQKSDLENGIIGCGEHSDYGMLTLLATDDVPGLQIFNKDGKWINVDPIPGAFIVNLGDMLERWTNNLFRSTRHRVVNQTGQERYSIPFFYEPNFDTLVECLPQCYDEQHLPLYPPIQSGDYLMNKYSQTHQQFQVKS